MITLDSYQRTLADVCKWNPDDPAFPPKVEINNTKICHIAKRKLYDESYASLKHRLEVMTEKCTVYNLLKLHPMGNLYLYIMNKLTAETLLDLVEKGKGANGLYPYAMDEGMEYLQAIIATQRELTEAAAAIPSSVLTSEDTEYRLPEDTDTLSAIDDLLDGVNSPPLHNWVNKIASLKHETTSAKEAAKVLVGTVAERNSEITRLSDEVTRLNSIARTAGPVEYTPEPDGEIPEGQVEWKKASEVFDCEFKVDLEVPTWEWSGPNPRVPVIDEHYIFRPELVERVLYSIITNKRLYLSGHTGTGKTTLIEQVAARLGYMFIRLNFDSEITRMDLIGRDTLSSDDEGNVTSRFIDGILPTGLSLPVIMCFDEIDFVRPDVGYVLQSVLEGNGLRIPEDGDRLVNPHPMFRMMATGNTVGQGDEHGMYQGARPQSIALLDRFGVWGKVPSLQATEREDLLDRHFPALRKEDRSTILQYITEHMQAFETNKVLQPMSPRTMLSIAESVTVLGDTRTALAMTVLDRASNTDYSTLSGLIDRVCK